MIKEEYIKLEVQDIISDIREYFKNAGCSGAVIGNSGGKDSAVVIGLMSLALGSENVIAVKLPCGSNLQDSIDADLVAKTFGVKSYTIPLDIVFYKMVSTIQKSTGITLNEQALINTKPCIRKDVLCAIAKCYNYLVCGTGNKCEIAVGYFTKSGDGVYDYNPIGEYYVEEVYQIARFIGVPEKVLLKAPADGLSNLTDEEKLGVTYSEITEFLEKGSIPNKISEEKIKKLIKSSEHKRKMPYVYHRKRYE